MLKNIDLLVGEHCPELLCGICQDILDEPIQVHCPEDHLFCSQCIQTHLEKENTCPQCFTLLEKHSFQLSKFAQRQISRLRVFCPYQANGCTWEGLIADCHAEKCDYMSFTCPNVSHGCTESALSSSCFEEHRKECAYEQLSCPNHRPECQPFFRKDLEKHERECASYVCPYAYEGCPFISTAEKIKTHCEAYCGRLHQSIQDLTKKVDELRQQIQNTSPGQIQSLLPVAASDSPAQLTKESQDTSMSEMALFHEMFNSHLFDPLESDTAPDTQAIDSLTDFGSLDFLKLFSNTSFSPSTTSSPQPLTFVPPKTVPKRTTHGKKIRYSKDVRLAHGALRMARERTAQTTSEQPNDYALNSTRQKQPLCRNIEDSKSKKKPANSFVEPSQDLAPKRRPMFVLASSYLSNYNLPSVD